VVQNDLRKVASSPANLAAADSGRQGMYIDGAVYPDLDTPPSDLPTDYDKADYLHRVVTAWDIGIMPERATLALLGTWREIFDQFPVPLSPGYHALRMVFDWPPVPVPPNTAVAELRYQRLDRLEGRPADPCEDEV
jgi:hypothetical protein